ncbi:1514_t:CDS:2 [Acaulospora colombiana]|uniref:1514_t:CDS:1 n=1 Tax=Acaulospora colombiana TaxID=27376 RepID=A0ACA9K7Z9_9GLOM|nr:1514_t:CDS:2 [Acaulospora colombiana]
MEISNICIGEFPLLFSSAGICKDSSGKFNKFSELLRLLNEEANEVQEEIDGANIEIKRWLERDLSAESVNYYSKGITELYPTETSPECQGFDITYRERYFIGRQFVSGRKKCHEKMQECLEMCDESNRSLRNSVTKTGNVIKLAKNLLVKFNSLAEKNDDNLESTANRVIRAQTVNILNSINDRLEKYREDINANRKKITACRELLDATEVQFNRIRLGRAPAYGEQVQNCDLCGKPYVYIKWCKSCDRNRFRGQFSKWTSGEDIIDKFIRETQTSINHPNCYAEWIPYEQFTNIQFIGKGGFATVYSATWVNGLGIWDYALGKRVRHPNTPVVLKYLAGSQQRIDTNFFKEITAYMKILSSRVLHCYGISRDPETKDYIMILPYAHGGNLLDYLKKRWTKLKWKNKLDILRHMTYGIVDIHMPFSDRKCDVELGIDICEGVRPEIVRNTPPVYAELMQRCWSGDKDARPTSEEIYDKVKRWLSEMEDLSSEIAKQFVDNSTVPDDDIVINGDSKCTSRNLSGITKSLKSYYEQKARESTEDFNDTFDSLNSFDSSSADSHSADSHSADSKSADSKSADSRSTDAEESQSSLGDFEVDIGNREKKNIDYFDELGGDNDDDASNSDDIWNSVQERDFISWLTKFNILGDYSKSDIGVLFKG